MIVKEIESKSFSTTVWSGGETTEIFLYPPNGSYANRNFNARISSASVNDSISIFTKLDGVDRYLMVLEGNVSLEVDGVQGAELSPLQIQHFSGSANTVSHGVCKDFNLMLKDGATGSLECINIDGNNIELPIEKDCIYVLYSYYSILTIDKKTISKNKAIAIFGDKNEIITVKKTIGRGDLILSTIKL